MLTINVKGGELYDDEHNKFIQGKDQVLCLEHSLVSVSKWEAKWHKPFLDDRVQKTREEVLDYIKCMTITQNVDPATYYLLSNDNIKKIQDYISDPMTATWFSDKKKKPPSRKVITSEVIYYWMVALQIPFECQKWHLNRLLTLIKVCNEESKAAEKSSKNTKELMSERAALNAARRKQLNTRG
jgi:hypothetical protein